MKRALRIVVTLVVTGFCIAYLVWQINLSRTVDILRGADLAPFLLAAAIMVVTIWPMALRWQWLLAAKGIPDKLSWLTRAYFVSYTAAQVLPTAVGGDAVRIFETARRHPGRTGVIAGSVMLERAIGGAATLALAAAGFLLAIGRYDVGPYLWIEFMLLVGTILLGVVFFSRAAQRLLVRLVPVVRLFRVERPLRALYDGIHTYRANVVLLGYVFVASLGIQVVRVLAIWLCGESVGIELSLRPYYVMGPLLFLVTLVPFTANGLAVREAFFVSFLGGLGVDADAAFAAGFVFFIVTMAMALPGALILGWTMLRSGVRRSPAEAPEAARPARPDQPSEIEAPEDRLGDRADEPAERPPVPR